jgi:hypothetical protein
VADKPSEQGVGLWCTRTCNRQPSDALPSNNEWFATNSVELPDVCISLTHNADIFSSLLWTYQQHVF